MTLKIKEAIMAVVPNVNKTHLNTLAPFLEKELSAGGYGESIGLTKNRLAMFLAQIIHESGALRYTRESGTLSYFKKRYGDRKGIPPVDKDNRDDLDYWYIGRGVLQITFIDNYKKVGEALDIDCIGTPSLLEEPDNCVKSAIWFWNTNHLNKFADVDDCRSCTKRINGGFNGLAERKAFYNKFKAYLNDEKFEHLPTPLALTNFEMVAVQTKLKALDYHETGSVDSTGDRTVAAVAALQHNEGLPINGMVDQETLDALDSAQPRPISEARAEGVPTGVAAATAKGMTVLGAVTTSATALTPALDQIEQVKGVVTRIQDLFTPIQDMIVQHPQMVVVGVAIGIGIIGYVIYENLVNSYRQGKSFN